MFSFGEVVSRRSLVVSRNKGLQPDDFIKPAD